MGSTINGKTLIIIDMQNDFITGALANKDAEAIIPGIADFSFMRMVQREILEEKGYTIVGEASDGIEAIERYETLRPDVIILDITMPNMNGLDAMHRIFEFDRAAKIIIWTKRVRRL